ncbi:pickpocket protein 11-like [Pieris rapae]|uniref:pickpocket protein 11-like n=1 Tax=Pieris rapae TaxID=64459 RepID=UPI001E27F4FF|nr:pickpocket protein 11-like [Pieris rapae]
MFLFKRKRNRRKVFNYVKDGLRNATTHGLSYVVNDRIHPFERIFWMIGFLIAFTLIMLLLTIQFSRYIDAPTVISVDMDYFDWNISFPAVTLCPFYKAIIPKLKAISSRKFNETGLNIDGYLWAIVQANFDSLEYIKLDFPDDVISTLEPRDYVKIAMSMYPNFNATVETKTKQNISIVTAMTEMGLCYVLNSNVAIFDDPNRESFNISNYVKNNIELSIFDRDFFIRVSNFYKSYKVYIHSPDEIITSTTPSYNIDIEAAVSFGLSVWTTRISEELRVTSLRIRKCRFINEATNDRYPIYSYSHCLLECRINVIKTLCGCIPHFYKPLAHETICHIRQLKCLIRYKREILTLSTESINLNGLPSSSRECGCLNTCELDQYLKDREDFTTETSFTTLDIGITTFPKVRVVRDIIVHSYDILLRSGGVINLCIGSSVISLMEILVTFIKTCHYILF